LNQNAHAAVHKKFFIKPHTKCLQFSNVRSKIDSSYQAIPPVGFGLTTCWYKWHPAEQMTQRGYPSIDQGEMGWFVTTELA